MKVTDETKFTSRLREDIDDLLTFYCELDDISADKFIVVFKKQLEELLDYHKSQHEKLSQLRRKLGLNEVIFDDYNFNLNFGSDNVVGGSGMLGGMGNDFIDFGLDTMKVASAADITTLGGDLKYEPQQEYHSDYYWDTDRNK